MTNYEIDRLLRRTAAGDKAAIAELYEKFRMPVYYYALHLLGNKELAEDVMQETFVSFLRSSSTYRQSGKASAWIFTITKNKAIDWKRKERLSVSYDGAENLLNPVADIAESVDDTELTMLSCLNEKERDILSEDEENNNDAVVSDEDLFGELTEQVLSKYAEAIVSGISEALDDFAKEKGIDAENLSDEDIMEALDRWADEIIGKEMEILTTGQQAKELFLLSRDIPQESDFSGKKENHSRSGAYRKLYHTRSKISMCLFSDFLEDKVAREEAIYSASPEELAEASAYVDGFYGLFSASDRRILDLLLDGKTQLEIAAELRISQSKVSKRRKHLQQILLEYDPDVKKILHLFKNNSQQME